MKKVFTLIAFLCCTHLFAQPSDTYLLGQMDAGNMPGANFVIIKDGKWVYQRSLGMANIDNSEAVQLNTVFMMASVSKTMIATAMMQLWEKGMIDLDANVDNYLPFTVHTPSHPGDSITPRMLLTHTAAIEDNWNVMGPLYVYGDSPVGLDSFLKNYHTPGGIYYNAAANFYLYKPGAQYNYSNIGSTLAAYIVERITGDHFAHYCDTAIFQKLCMNNTSFWLAGIQDTNLIARPYSRDAGVYYDMGLYGYPDYPDGQLRTNITALARFMTMYMQNGIYNGTRILDSTTVAYMLQQQASVASWQGLIFYSAPSSNGDVLWGHNGGDAGVNTAMYFNKEKKTGVIVLTNGDGTSAMNADGLVDTLYKYGLTITPAVTDTFPACNMTTDVEDVVHHADVELYPNPTTGDIYINTPVAAQTAIINMQGQVVASFPVHAGTNRIEMHAALSSGLYLAKVYTGRATVMAVKRITLVR